MKSFIPTLILLVFISCSQSPTNTQKPGITAGIKGKLLDANNNPVSGAIVRLFPVNYVPSLSASKIQVASLDTTNENGVYEIPNVDTGTYNLEGQKETLGVFIDSISVDDDTSIIDVPPGQLKKLGKITGITHMPGQNDTNQVRITLYIPGTGRVTKPIIGGRFTFDRTPEGRYQIIIDPTLNNYNVKIIDTSILAGTTLDLDTILLSTFSPDTIDIVASSITGLWGPNKVYRVFNDVTIPAGATLTVLPATTVLFMGNFQLDTYGILNCYGSADSLINFRYGFSGGAWFGILIHETTQTSFNYCIFENMNWYIGLSLTEHEQYFNNCIFQHCKNGIHISEKHAPICIANCIFNDITGIGIKIDVFSDSERNTLSFKNNIVVSCSLGLVFRNVNLDIKANCFYGNSVRDISFATSQFTYEGFQLLDTTLTIQADPKFISLEYSKENYHLQFSSPCKGTGVNGTDMGIYSLFKL